APVDCEPPLPRFRVGDELALPPLRKALSLALLQGTVFAVEFAAQLGPDQAVDDADAARRVLDVDHRGVIARGDLYRRVFGSGRRAANQERHLEALAFHLARNVDHFVE